MRERLGYMIAGVSGAALVYFLDPTLGKRRRASVGEKAIHVSKTGTHFLGVTARDTTNRVRGAWAEAGHVLSRKPVDDYTLIERVRAAMGRVVGHPSSIEIDAEGGHVVLRGAVLKHEHNRLLDCVRKVRGVRSVEDQLAVHKQAAGISELQGGTRRIQRSEFMQSNWAPAIRALAIAGGGGAAVLGLAWRGLGGTALAGAGSLLLARGVTNIETRRLLGIKSGRRAVDLQKTIEIAAPVDRVFSMWTTYENFPMFMSRVREVRDLGGGRSHWIVRGPANARIEWDAVVTQYIPNQVIAWKTEPGAVVEHAGIIHFQPEHKINTRVHIRMSYNPPAGALGHSIAWLAGADAKRELDEDLVRMKSFIETGVRPHDAARRGVA